MKYNLAALTRRARNPRRSAIVIRDIVPPATLASDLYASCYKPVVELWQRASSRIVSEYARTLSAMTTDAPSDLQAALNAADSEFERIFLLLEASLREWGLRVERWQRDKFRGAILSATGVDIATLIGPEDMRATVEQYLTWNTDLIRDVNAQARKRISDSVFAGLQNRTPARDVAKQIHEATDMSRRRSIGIASDQLSKLSSALADERRREAGLDVWKWRHSGKRHPRETHIARNGNLYADSGSSGMVGREIEGKAVQAPPPENDRPGRPPYCGCRGQAVLVLD